jgi:hypothetical protein
MARKTENQMPPMTFPIERSELDDMKKLQVRNHRGWPAVFSTNSLYQIWCCTHFGNTPRDERLFVQGELRVVDQIAQIYRGERPEGGRFFISDEGAFYCEEHSEQIQFIEFEFID